MKKISLPLLAVLVLAIPLTASAQSAKEKLVGTWVAELELDEAKLQKQTGLGDAEFKQILEAIKPQFADFTITFTINADGTSEAHVKGAGQDKKEKGKWEVVEEKGKTVKIKGTDDEGKEEVLTIEFDGNDKFSMVSPDLDKAPIKKPVFKRKKN